MKKSKQKVRKVTLDRTIKPIPKVKQVLRGQWKLVGIVTSAAAEEPVTRGNCLSALTMATTTTQVARLFMTCRIRKVSIWQVSSSATNPLGINATPSFPSVEFESDAGPLGKTLNPQLGTEPGYVEARPPSHSFAGFDSISGINETDVLFRYNCAANAIIQVVMDYEINDSSVTAVTGSSSGRTVGEVYYSLGAKIAFANMNN